MFGKGTGKQEPYQVQSWQNLNKLFGTASDTAKQFGASGKEALDPVKAYFKSILTGSRTDAESAMSPATNAARDSADAARQEKARTGTSRTGGDVAANQQAQDEVRKQIDTLISAARPLAAQELGTLGEADINAMMNALGLATSATGTQGQLVGSDINARRQASAELWSSIIGAI